MSRSAPHERGGPRVAKVGAMRRRRRLALAVFSLLGAFAGTRLPADNATTSMSGPSMFKQRDGAALFQAICQGCHMPDARGASGAGAYPALAHNDRLAAAAYPVLTVLKGRKGMPSLASYLTDAQVAAVVNYVRTHFDNSYPDVVSEAMVARER